MINTQYINLNMVTSGVLPVLHCAQYDIGRPLGFVVYDSSSTVDLDSYTCTIEATRTDGTAITAAVTTDGNVGAFSTTSTMTNVADEYKAQLVIVDSSSNRVASLPFIMRIVEAAMDENSEAIEEDASLYEQYTVAVQALIAAINEDISELQAQTFNVLSYGIEPDTGDDLYSELYELMHTVDTAGGGIVYFPPGEYIISDCIFIPENTSLVGAGPSTHIIFDETYTSMGVGLSNGGDNVSIENMTVDCVDTSEPVNASMTGAIGFSVYDFDSWSSEHISPTSMTTSAKKNLAARNLWTTTHYILQTEPGDTYTIDNVVYEHIHAENSCVSVLASAEVSGVYMNDITCAWLRFGSMASYNCDGVLINIRCGNLWARGNNTDIYGLRILPELKYDDTGYIGVLVFRGNLNIVGAEIDASAATYGVNRYGGTCRMTNVNLTGATTSNWTNTTTTDLYQNYFVNCTVTTGDATSSAAIYGYAYNSSIATSGVIYPGLPDAISISSSADLDDYTVAGQYYGATTAIATSLTNAPDGLSSNFTMAVMKISGLAVQVIYPGGGNGEIYMRSETSSGFQSWVEFVDSSQVMLNTSTTISSGDDLDSYTTNGVYGCASSTIAASLSNSPVTSSGFALFVTRYGGYTIQTIFNGSAMYCRKQSSSGYGSWYKYTGTAV